MKYEKNWETFRSTAYSVIERVKVEGGYLYHVTILSSEHTDMCFVPDIDLQRYQSHLRDAYTQGYKDGQEDAKEGILNPEEGLTKY